MLLPAITGSGESLLVTARSALVLTVVVSVAELLPDVGSTLVAAAVAVLLSVVPCGRFALTFTTTVNTPLSPVLTRAGSVVVLAATALLVSVVPAEVFELTFTTTVNTALSPAAAGALENTTLPVPPTEGALVAQPVPVVTAADTNVVFAGVASVT